MPNRQMVLVHHIRLAIHNTALTLKSYATLVAQHYLLQVPLHARGIDWHASTDIYADERANAQILSRMLDGTVRIPVELEESLVLCLPQPYQGEVQRALAERLGLLAAPLPRGDGARDVVHVAELMRETGEALTALAPMLADGRIDSADAPHARRALLEVRDVMARCVSIEAMLVSCLATAPKRDNVAPMRARGAA